MRLARNVFPSRVWAPFVFGALALVVGWVLSVTLPSQIVFIAIGGVVAIVALLGLGIVTGSAGMIVLSQLSFAAVGAWVVAWATTVGVPGGFIVHLLLGALAAGAVGLLLGLPALRLRGVNLAVVTLGFAAAAELTLVKLQFPGQSQGVRVVRPELFSTDRGFFMLAIIILVVVAIVVFFMQNSRLGSSWRAVAFSERGAAAAGSNIRLAKLSAFAVSAAIAGVSGALLTAQVGSPYASSFTTLQSLALYVLAVVFGTHLLEAAVFAGIMWVLVPELLKRWGVSQDWGFVVFGILGIQTLTTGTSVGQQFRDWLHRRKFRGQSFDTSLTPMPQADVDAELLSAPGAGAPVLVGENLSVTYGELRALSDVSFSISEREIVGLIGPNGAGKSTLVDVLTGFVASNDGTVTLNGEDLGRMAPNQRARQGLRRTFQQDRVPPTLSVGDYIEFVSRSKVSRDEIRSALEFFGLPGPRVRISDIDVGTRRILEVTANLLAKPKVLVLDEPAAGLSHEEHIALGQRLKLVPQRFDTALLIIEHDLDLVRMVSDRAFVLNFGEVIATGTVDEVLADPTVAKAYMGENELL